MALVLVTILSETKREDLALTDNIPLQELIPSIVDRCIPDARQRNLARWVIGVPGRPPLPYTQSLAQCGVLDGSLLYLRDTNSPVPPPPPLPLPHTPPPVASTVPELNVDAVLASQATPSSRRIPIWIAVFIGFWAVVLDAVIIRLTGTFIPGTVLALIIIAAAVFFSLPRRLLEHDADAPSPAAPPSQTPLQQPAYDAASRPAAPQSPSPQLPGYAAVPPPQAPSLNELVENVIFDLGRLMAGESPDLKYCAPQVVQYFSSLLAPSRERREWFTPQFGGTVDVSLSRNASRPNDPVVATVQINDQSIRHLPNGESVAPPQRKVSLTLVIDEHQATIVDARVVSSVGLWP